MMILTHYLLFLYNILLDKCVGLHRQIKPGKKEQPAIFYS